MDITIVSQKEGVTLTGRTPPAKRKSGLIERLCYKSDKGKEFFGSRKACAQALDVLPLRKWPIH